MEGIALPAELETALEEMGVQWPDTKEIALGERSMEYGRFVVKGALSSHAAATAVSTMNASNRSDGLTAFQRHFETIGGPTGHMSRAMVVDTATGIAVGEAAAAVVEYKLFVLEILGDVAAEGVVALAGAIETGGASLVAYAELLAEEAAVVYEAEAALVGGLEAIGATASLVAGGLLDGAITRLQNRELHKSADGVTSFPTQEELESAEAEYKNRWTALSYDPDKKKVTSGSEREATVALGLEQAGKFPPGSVQRSAAGGGDFVVIGPNGSTQMWDIKGVPSFVPGGLASMRQCYSDARAEVLVADQFSKGRNVVFDTSKMSREDIASLVALIRRHPEWDGRVVVY